MILVIVAAMRQVDEVRPEPLSDTLQRNDEVLKARIQPLVREAEKDRVAVPEVPFRVERAAPLSLGPLAIRRVLVDTVRDEAHVNVVTASDVTQDGAAGA